LFICLALGLCVAVLLTYWLWQQRLEHSQDVPIRAAAERYRVEAALIKAIVWRESRFHPNARGRAAGIQ
jgi:soluble lytic murein transglycosylase-like protein